MPSWPLARLGDLVEVLDHLRVPVREEDREDGQVPYYGANGQQGWIDRPLFDEPLILLAEDGGHFDEYATRDIGYRIEGPSWVNNHAHVIRALAGHDQGFLFWALRNKDIRRYISGGTRGKLTQGELQAIELRTPPLAEQRRIAEILDTIDEAIQDTKRLIAKLEMMRDGFFLEQIEGSDDRWQTATLGDLSIKIQDGSHFSPQSTHGPFRYLTSRNIRPRRIDLASSGWISSAEHRSIYRRCDVQPGDLLLTKDGANTGNACINHLEEEFSLLSSVCMVRFETQVAEPGFYMEYLLSQTGRDQIELAMSGNAITRLTLEKVRHLSVPLLPLREQKAIWAACKGFSDRINAEAAYSRGLAWLRSGLASDLLSRQVRTVVS